MAMTHNAPLTPPAVHSPTSSDSSVRTPTSPTMQTVTIPVDQFSSGPVSAGPTSSPSAASAQMKRKPSRRANTAERRATHNAVERQRRETLNGRFLDLAALLPNLSQIRRPSKSSIVNNSIAYIHASRRHRLLAARELRTVKVEADALRRELNEWRDRANLPRVEEPPRGDGFNMVLSAEIEVLAAVAEDEDEAGGHDGYDDGDDDFGAVGPQSGNEDMDDPRAQVAATMLKNVGANPVALGLSSGGNVYLPQLLAQPTHGPMIVTNPPSVSYENPAMSSLYEPAFDSSGNYLQPQSRQEVEKAAWNAQLFTGAPQTQQVLQPRAFLNLPHSAQSLSTSSSASSSPASPFADPATQAYFANIQRQQQQINAAMQQQQLELGRIFGSPDRDDASSVGSGRSGRERSGSIGTGSGYNSPPLASPTDYDLCASGINANDFGVSRRLSTGSMHVNNARTWCQPGDAGADGMGLMAQNIGLPISVGGGGNGGGFLMMM